MQIKRPIMCVYNSCVYFEDIRIVGLKFGPLGQKFFAVASFCVKSNNLPRGEIVPAPITLVPFRVSDFCHRSSVDLNKFIRLTMFSFCNKSLSRHSNAKAEQKPFCYLEIHFSLILINISEIRQKFFLRL